MAQAADDITPSEAAEVDDYFHFVKQATSAPVGHNDLLSPPPRCPTGESLVTNSDSNTPGEGESAASGNSGFHVNLPLSTSLGVNKAIWRSSLRWPVLLLTVIAMVTVACWQRQVFVALVESESDPPLTIAAVVIGKAVLSATILLCVNLVFGLGMTPERFLFQRWIVFGIAVTMFFSTALAAYSFGALSWPTAVVVNPLAFAPLFFLLFSPMLGQRVKRLPRTAVTILTVTILGLCFGLIRGIADNSFLSEDGRSIGEGFGCVLSVVSGLLLGLSFALIERHVIVHPTLPLYLLSVTSFVEVVMLPLIILLDMTPVIGSSSDFVSSVGRFFSLHRSSIPPAVGWLVIAHTALVCVVLPLLARAPSLLVPMFSCGPLIAASVFPGPSLPVIVGGCYAFLVIILLLAAEAEYDEDTVAALQRKMTVVCARGKVSSLLWRHGASIVCVHPTAVDPTDSRQNNTNMVNNAAEGIQWGERVRDTMMIMGWAPISAVHRGYIRFSTSVTKSTRRDRYGYSVLRLTGMNRDD